MALQFLVARQENSPCLLAGQRQARPVICASRRRRRPDREAEIVLVSYRSRKFGTAAVKWLRWLESRWEAEHWLAARGITRNYGIADLENDGLTLARLFDQAH